MYELCKRTAQKEVIVGWYATGGEGGLGTYSALIQNFFEKETGGNQAVHLTVDVELAGQGDEGLGIRGYVR